VHDFVNLDGSADTVLRLVDLFERYGVRGDFYLTAPMVALYAERLRREALRLALERADGSVSVFETIVFAPGTPLFGLNLRYVERIVKFLLWQRGGWKVHVGGPNEIGEHIRAEYAPGGAREFDAVFMGGVYEHPFTVVATEADNVPGAKETTGPLGRRLDGCRVGFDLGASDRKASAVIGGEAIYSEEVA
jgi:hypothetical protein